VIEAASGLVCSVCGWPAILGSCSSPESDLADELRALVEIPRLFPGKKTLTSYLPAPVARDAECTDVPEFQAVAKVASAQACLA
jgi:hypothetical protein